jgi:hypothetical protein
MELERYFPSSQEPDRGTSPEPYEFSPYLHTLYSSKYILMSSTRLRLGVLDGLIRSDSRLQFCMLCA